MEAYNELALAYESLKSISRQEIVQISQSLKTITKKRKALEKHEAHYATLCLVRKAFISLFQSGTCDEEVVE